MLSFNSPFLSQPPPHHHHQRRRLSSNRPHLVVTSNLQSPPPKLILLPSSSSPSLTHSPSLTQSFYQPFHPPSSPLPAELSSLDTASQIDVLTNRLGLWHSYAPLIASLLRDGSFTPSSLEEITGIPGSEQNRLIVAAQVRDSILQSGASPELAAAFDSHFAAKLLYEIRLLNTAQRLAAAEYIVGNGLDEKGAADVARAIKDFPRRKTERGFRSFDYNYPGDCLAFMLVRLGREHGEGTQERAAAFARALEAVVTEDAKLAVEEEIAGKGAKGDEDESDVVRVPVVRLRIGEVAEATSVVVLPVCGGEVGELAEAPREARGSGEFGVVTAEKGWRRWVVLPRWEPVAAIDRGGGVAVEFRDARVLPWKANRWSKEEGILVVVDRDRSRVESNDGFYMVAAGEDDGGVRVERGWKLNEEGVEESVGSVVLVVRPPREEADDQLSDEDWE